jgi:hypothetical protein
MLELLNNFDRVCTVQAVPSAGTTHAEMLLRSIVTENSHIVTSEVTISGYTHHHTCFCE